MIKIQNYNPNEKILMRSREISGVDETVREIIQRVRTEGDTALHSYALKFDKCDMADFELDKSEMKHAYDKCDGAFRKVLEKAADNIREYHSRQKRSGFEITRENGVIIGQRVMPVEKVGLYVPGGTAAYPSSVLMNCIPASIAGVPEIIMTTPPAPDGGVRSDILAAAYIAGVSRVFRIGGAQAIAALAFGTKTVPAVDKIVGPGNAFVAEAKRQVFGIVDIDMIAGPSEILIIADEKCNPAFVAADMLSQAEHDKNASAVLITTSYDFAASVASELEKQLKVLPREEIARASIEANGKLIVTDGIDAAIDCANMLAPEHLELCLDDAYKLLTRIKNAGSVFLGRYCPEAVGDYYSGTNHTLPTGGTARFSSALSVDDFVKKTEYTLYPRNALLSDADDIALFANREGLDAHGRSVLIRKEADE